MLAPAHLTPVRAWHAAVGLGFAAVPWSHAGVRSAISNPATSIAVFSASLLVACSSSEPPGVSDVNTTSAGPTTASNSSSTTGAGSCDPANGESFALGDIASDWTLPNELGEMVSLYAGCGKVVYYEVGSIW